MKKTFTDFVMENTIAEKDLGKGRFEIFDTGFGGSFQYSKGTANFLK